MRNPWNKRGDRLDRSLPGHPRSVWQVEERSSFQVDPVINIPDRKFGLFKRGDAGEQQHQKFIVGHEAVHDLPNPVRRITFSRDAAYQWMDGEQEDTRNGLRLCSVSLVRAIATCVNDLWGVCVVLSMIHSSRLLQSFAFPPQLLFRSSFRNQWVFHRVILSFPPHPHPPFVGR